MARDRVKIPTAKETDVHWPLGFRRGRLIEMKISAVLFDLDDTLLDHTTAIEQAAAALVDTVVPNAQADERSRFVASWKTLNREWYQKFYAQQITFQESGRGKLRDAFRTFG